MPSFIPLEQVGLLVTDERREPDERRPVLDRLKAMRPGTRERARLAVPALAEGEQYRFHFDMTRCIGCRCCEVACNEQNNNPPDVSWRRVGEIEGGTYPDTVRLHLSMACNHCLDPSCLEGCPVDAYTKLETGIVVHDAETCIGCQYCVWNCPYGVPQYHAERRVVTKCHLCVDRLSAGQLPACVEACPSRAIEIEAVDVAEWRQKIEQADAPGVPPADLTFSTTRITLPEGLDDSMGKGDPQLLAPPPAHPSLAVFLVLSQWSVGLWGVLPFAAADAGSRLALALAALATSWAAIFAAVFHLGRPVYALRAVRAWRHSWLSREVIAFGLFAAAGAVAALAALLRWPSIVFHDSLALTMLLGLAGVAASAGIYRIPARPAWDSGRTPVSFFATAVLLGGASGLLVAAPVGRAPLAAVASGAALVAAFTPWHLVLRGLGSEDLAVRGAALLLTRRFARLFWARTLVLCAVAGLAVAAVFAGARGAHARTALAAPALALAVLAELAGRYLFFVTVVPRNMPEGFFSSRSAARGS
jgi:DMSO reductase iron-sulfur subunit